MDKRRGVTISKNSIFLGVSFLSKLILFSVLARKFEKQDIGIILYALAIMDIIFGISSFGVPQLAIREISRGHKKLKSFFTNILFIRFASTLIVFFCIAVIIFSGIFTHDREKIWIIFFISLAVIPKTLTECLDIIFAVEEKFIYPAGLEILSQIFFVGGCALLFFIKFDLKTVAIFYLGVSCFVSLVRLFILRGRFPISLRKLNASECSSIFTMLLPFGILSLTLIFYIRIGDVLLARISADGITELAVFKMAHFPIMSISALLSVCVTPFYANVAKIDFNNHSSGLNQIAHTLHKAIKYIILLGCFIVIGPTLLAKEIIVFVCGANWASSAVLFKMMLWIAPLASITAITARTLQTVGRQKEVAVAGVVVLFVKLFLLLLLLPKYGAMGLAVVTIFSSIFYLLYCYGLLKIHVQSTEHVMVIVKPAVVAGVAIVAAWASPFKSKIADLLICYFGFFMLVLSTGLLRLDEIGEILRGAVKISKADSETVL